MSPEYDVEMAFDDLKAVVEDLRTRGKQLNAAGLKPLLQKESNHRFSEVDLNFDSFKAFLEAAAEHFDDFKVEGEGPYLRIVVDGDHKPQAPTRIRSEVWAAFVGRRDADGPYSWDTLDRRIRRAQDAPDLFSDPDRFVPIDPIDQSVHEAWMRQFAAESEDQVLRFILEGADRPRADFMSYVRSKSELLDLWRSYSVERAADEIKAWLDRNGIDTPIYVGETTSEEVDEPSRTELEPERAAALRIVEAMTLEELAQLSFPIEAIGRAYE